MYAAMLITVPQNDSKAAKTAFSKVFANEIVKVSFSLMLTADFSSPRAVLNFLYHIYYMLVMCTYLCVWLLV